MKEKIVMKEVQYGTDEYEKTIDIRNDAFRKPQGLNIRDEDLSGDKELLMFAGYIDGEMMSTVFLAHKDEKTAQVKSVIVIDKYKGLGLGKYLMDFIEDLAKEEGYEKMILMGRVKVEEFYKKLGYTTTSDPFDYYTIPHVYMEKML